MEQDLACGLSKAALKMWRVRSLKTLSKSLLAHSAIVDIVDILKLQGLLYSI